jgi:hypothetical protein
MKSSSVNSEIGVESARIADELTTEAGILGLSEADRNVLITCIHFRIGLEILNLAGADTANSRDLTESIKLADQLREGGRSPNAVPQTGSLTENMQRTRDGWMMHFLIHRYSPENRSKPDTAFSFPAITRDKMPQGAVDMRESMYSKAIDAAVHIKNKYALPNFDFKQMERETMNKICSLDPLLASILETEEKVNSPNFRPIPFGDWVCQAIQQEYISRLDIAAPNTNPSNNIFERMKSELHSKLGSNERSSTEAEQEIEGLMNGDIITVKAGKPVNPEKHANNKNIVEEYSRRIANVIDEIWDEKLGKRNAR